MHQPSSEWLVRAPAICNDDKLLHGFALCLPNLHMLENELIMPLDLMVGPALDVQDGDTRPSQNIEMLWGFMSSGHELDQY